jgi:hypothetical protein
MDVRENLLDPGGFHRRQTAAVNSTGDLAHRGLSGGLPCGELALQLGEGAIPIPVSGRLREDGLN